MFTYGDLWPFYPLLDTGAFDWGCQRHTGIEKNVLQHAHLDDASVGLNWRLRLSESLYVSASVCLSLCVCLSLSLCSLLACRFLGDRL